MPGKFAFSFWIDVDVAKKFVDDCSADGVSVSSRLRELVYEELELTPPPKRVLGVRKTKEVQPIERPEFFEKVRVWSNARSLATKATTAEVTMQVLGEPDMGARWGVGKSLGLLGWQKRGKKWWKVIADPVAADGPVESREPEGR